jgi:hypothetical protein
MKLLPFDLEKAKNGAKVVTRDWRIVRILDSQNPGSSPITAHIVSPNGTVSSHRYTIDGTLFRESPAYGDLFLVADDSSPSQESAYELRADGSVLFHGDHFFTASQMKELVKRWEKLLSLAPAWPKYWIHTFTPVTGSTTIYRADHLNYTVWICGSDGACKKQAEGEGCISDLAARHPTMFIPITRHEAALYIGAENL